jgi:hypothetical protein
MRNEASRFVIILTNKSIAMRYEMVVAPACERGMREVLVARRDAQ